MQDTEFVNTMREVSFLVRETFDLKNILSPSDFYKLWNRNVNKLQVNDKIKTSHEGKLCFYNHYLMLKLLEKASTQAEHNVYGAANDTRLYCVS